MPENYLVKLFHLLKLTHEILTSVGVRYIACGGTLLSILRSGYLTPWDDDGDINVFQEDYEKKIDEIDILLKKHKVYLDGSFGTFDTLKLRFSDDNPMLQQYPSEDLPFIDWFMYKKIDKDTYNYGNQILRLLYPFEYLTESDLFPLKMMTLKPTKSSNESINLFVANNTTAVINRSLGTKENPQLWKSCHLASSHRDMNLLLKPCQLSQQQIQYFNYN